MDKDDSITAQATTDQLVANIVDTLQDDVQMDSDLVEILSDHILKLAPAESAVSDAVKAIETLAEKRAEKPDNGQADHD